MISQASARAFGSLPPAEWLATAIYNTANESPDRIAIVVRAGTPSRHAITYGELARRLSDCETQLQSAGFPGIVLIDAGIDSLVLTAAVCGLLHIPLAILSNDSAFLAERLAGWLHVDDSLSLATGRPAVAVSGYLATSTPFSDVSVATSGTTGPPQLVCHPWYKVVAAVRFSMKWRDRTWALVYDTARWAGLQVWLQALLTGGRIVVPAGSDPDVVALALVEEGVSVLPATPTLLRRLLISANKNVLRATVLETITLGGEIADAFLLDLTASSLPQARVTHTYATSELGEVFHVTDGQAGFPAEWIGRRLTSGAQISVDADGELIVRASPNSANLRTGDLVTRKGNRFEFVGRRDDVIIVGGAKVYPEQVESVIRSVQGVADARVYAIPNSITGFIVACEVALAEPIPDGASTEPIITAVLTVCQMRLPAHAVPRSFALANQITVPAVSLLGSV